MRRNQENSGRILVWNHVSDKGNQINIMDDIFLCITYKEYNPRGFRNIYLKSNNETHFICINFYKFPLNSINSKLRFSHWIFLLKKDQIHFLFRRHICSSKIIHISEIYPKRYKEISYLSSQSSSTTCHLGCEEYGGNKQIEGRFKRNNRI